MSERPVSLATILRAIAADFLLSEEVLRRGSTKPVDEAHQAYVYVAKELTFNSDLTIGQLIGRGAQYVHLRGLAARERSHDDPTWARRMHALSVEVLVEAGVAGVKRPAFDDAPAAIAALCAGSSRDALGVSVAQLRVLGTAYLALREEIDVMPADADGRIAAGAHSLATAERALRDALATPGERAARRVRDAALETLLSLTAPSKERARATA